MGNITESYDKEEQEWESQDESYSINELQEIFPGAEPWMLKRTKDLYPKLDYEANYQKR